MSVEDELKARTLALVSRQMASWVSDIKRQIGTHQASLVRSLDELQDMVVRVDERIDEAAIGREVAAVLASQPPPAPPGPGFDRLRASLANIEKGSSLSEVLTYTLNEAAQYTERAAMFIVKGQGAIGWHSRGFDPAEALKQTNVPLANDTVFRAVQTSRQPARTKLSASPGTQQAMSRFGANRAILAVPLILRDKLAAVLYCDTARDEIPTPVADLVTVLVKFAEKIVDVLSAAPRAAVGRTTTGGSTPERAAAIRAGGDEIRERAGIPTAPPPPAPPPPPPPAHDEGSSTVMFNPGGMAAFRQQIATAAPRPAPPPAAVAPEDQKAHDDAKRFARLVVSEIKLYNETKVAEGRRSRDLYERLKDDVERGRQMYTDRVPAAVRATTNYFYDELVRILAGGDESALGPM
jgi:hypothetical protein